MHIIRGAYNALRMANRAKEIRELRGLSVAKAARDLNVTRGELYKVERGARRLTDVWIGKLANYYGVPPRNLVDNGPLSVSINYLVRKYVDSQVSPQSEAMEKRWVEPPGFVMAPQDCVGAVIQDESASRLYPPGTEVIVRQREKLGRRLRRGDRVLVKHFAATRAEGIVLEVVVGLLDVTVAGDLVVLLQTHNRTMAGAVVVREGFTAGEKDIDYEPDDADQGEVVGVVVAAIMPQ